MTRANRERIKNEPQNKSLSSKDLVDALLVKSESGNDEYWSLRAQLLIDELGYSRPFEPERGLGFKRSVELLCECMKSWGLPYEGALEVPPSPDFFAQSWAQENFASEIANIKSEIRRIHYQILTKFLELWRNQLGIPDESTTVAKLMERGLPSSELDDDYWFDDL